MYLKIRVIANSRVEEVTRHSDDHFTIRIRQKAERGMANKRVLEILQGMYPGKSVRIIHGHTSPSKLVVVD